MGKGKGSKGGQGMKGWGGGHIYADMLIVPSLHIF
jgi:hypothetical protein